MRFRTTIELGGKTATGFSVPDEVVAALCAGKRPAVRVTVGQHTYRTTIAPMGGRFLVPLSAENRAAAGVVAGDEVDVRTSSTTTPGTSPCRPTSLMLSRWISRRATSSKRLPTATARSGCAGSKTPRNRKPAQSASPRRSTRCGPANAPADDTTGVALAGERDSADWFGQRPCSVDHRRMGQVELIDSDGPVRW